MKPILLILALMWSQLHAGDLPNVLWIVSEDNSSHWIGCYGNEQAETPRIDGLAKQGVLFERAYSNAPVCAVARATLLNGAYSPTMGTQHMRSRHVIPEKYRPYPEYLRAAGYYCTNNAKTDYNFKGDDKAIWDESSRKAHYRNRPEGAPFFAVFNIEATHESSLFDKMPAEPQRLKPEEIKLPPYVPDLPEMRKDFARYHDRVSRMDAQVGALLDELEKQGLAEDTIVIYNSDHGGATPRGKRYLYETGVKVPLVVRIPEKWKALSKFVPGQRVEEPVSFVDFCPTFLSLAGIETPSQMKGRAFLGKKRVEPAEDEMEFLYADRFDEIYGMRRGLTDGKWKYTRCFTPHLPASPYSFYQFGQPGWRAWQKAWQEGKLGGLSKAIWESPQPVEGLYDLTNDPWEIHNLADDPAHAERLAILRGRLRDAMKRNTDTSLVPEPLFKEIAGEGAVAGFVQSDRFDIGRALDLAFAASHRDPAEIPVLKSALASESPVERYWAVSGLMILGERAVAEEDSVRPLLADASPVIRAVAGEALWRFGKKDEAKAVLVSEVEKEMDPSSLLYLLNTLWRLGLAKDLPEGWDKTKVGSKDAMDYINRFSERIAEEAKR